MSLSEEIRQRLEAAFAPRHLVVEDQSEAHRGHAGFQEGGESHWHLIIHADSFGPMTRLARQRAVHKAIGKDIIGRIHALSMDVQP